MKQSLNVGIIGTGKHGSRYVHHILKDLPELNLTAISRRSAEGKKQAKLWNTDYYSDWRDLVNAPEVTAIISVTPPHLNLQIAQQCILAGKPLLIEKPLAINKKEAQKIVNIFNDANLPLTVAQTLRYNNVILSLKEKLSQIGDLRSFTAHQRLEPIRLQWEDNPDIAGSGVIFQTAVHLFDAIRFITSKEIIRIRASTFKHNNAMLENIFTAQMELTDGIPGLVDASKVCPARSGRYEFIGSKGQLQGDQVHNTLEFIEGLNISSIPTGMASPTILPLLQDWHRFLQGDAHNPITGQEGLSAIKICQACLESAKRDEWVTV